MARTKISARKSTGGVQPKRKLAEVDVDYGDLTAAALKKVCRRRGVSDAGLKRDLVDRLNQVNGARVQMEAPNEENIRDFECVVCFEVMGGKIFQCTTGHAVTTPPHISSAY